MIKLKDAGERGGEITVTMTPFDLLSLQEAITRSTLRIQDFIDEYNNGTEQEKAALDKSGRILFGKPFLDIKQAVLKDDDANYTELQNVLNERNAILDAARS